MSKKKIKVLLNRFLKTYKKNKKFINMITYNDYKDFCTIYEYNFHIVALEMLLKLNVSESQMEILYNISLEYLSYTEELIKEKKEKNKFRFSDQKTRLSHILGI
jgi:hypothetical protein